MNRVALRFESQLARLDSLVVKAAAERNNLHKEVLLSYVVVRLHDQWNFRSRQIVLTSYGKSEERMMKCLRTNWTQKRNMDIGWEPDWHIPANTIRAAQILDIQDLIQVRDAIGSVSSIDDVIPFLNQT